MTAILAITAVELRRFLRDRSNIFFVFIFPLLLILVIGLQFGGDGGSHPRAAVAGEPSELREVLVSALEEDEVRITLVAADAARELVARGRADVAVIVPEPDDAGDGTEATVQLVAGSQATSRAAVQEVRSTIDGLSARRGQVQALVDAGVDQSAAVAALEQARAVVAAPEIEVVDTNELAQAFEGLGQFDLGAAQQLMLFVFLSSLAGSSTLIQARREGIVARTLAAPASTAQLIVGQALGRFAIAFVQGGYIMVGSTLLFGVAWGNVWLALLVLAFFSMVSAAAAMVLGSIMDNDSAASGVGVGAGLVLAGLGGSMLPLELFPDGLRVVSRFTPHAWGYEAFAQIQRHAGTLVDILPSLGVLAGMAIALFVLGTWLLRRSMARAI